jgi:hypothetical protein
VGRVVGLVVDAQGGQWHSNSSAGGQPGDEPGGLFLRVLMRAFAVANAPLEPAEAPVPRLGSGQVKVMDPQRLQLVVVVVAEDSEAGQVERG